MAKLSFRTLFFLIIINVVYASTSIFTKMASEQQMMTWSWLLWIVCAVGVMCIFALCWQQVLKRTELSTAYMFKGTSLIFVLLISSLLFGEVITIKNVIGAVIIIMGITLFAKV